MSLTMDTAGREAQIGNVSDAALRRLDGTLTPAEMVRLRSEPDRFRGAIDGAEFAVGNGWRVIARAYYSDS